MRVYVSLLKVRFLNGLQYRGAALGGLATQFFWGAMAIFLYQAFYRSSDASSAIAYKDLVTYIWLQQALYSIIAIYDWDRDLFDMITLGNISYELCRPISLYGTWYVKLFSKRLARAVLRAPAIIIVAMFLPAPYGLSPPQSGVSLLLFILTMSLGLVLLVAVSMLFYISVFKTLSPSGSMSFAFFIGEFFSGSLIPVPLMPFWLQNICMFLPFRWAADLPLRVYSGAIGTREALLSIAVQLAWIAVLVTIGMKIMERITKLSLVQGG